ncbi:mitochondrial proton/calcium exchanger protein-like isoform X1 [Cucurbita maxima]|uniref:Mitochondrial proton/calcium exchanger protein n=1 Tax=Cucurbita maxima TaxID=3661 RepID=A0A6J1K9Z0_CUCMA|nr:mitochondrial proton/calcium exchanger protein-like isoform X1 [Cucurbita maxima]XP_022996897.1 mitochondrial proton/calcium exchanger protein-like isoform X1 [Cucurbita maxima]XP_022996898.1 mitochondrial proton/calcium exchanger protein-like isoform X1 [Cucurbita maxima]XP_022996899.1 mitochondrial proton/calcium exchanger protein-like isoform X1 [Cucurbita maxima]
MALRAILVKRRHCFSSENLSTSLYLRFSRFEHEQASQADDLQRLGCISHPPPVAIDRGCEGGSSLVVRKEFLSFPVAEYFRSTLLNPQNFGHGIGRGASASCMGFRNVIQLSHYSTTATAGPPEFSGDNARNEKQSAKRIKEPSPEDCDQAVEGLSTVKAQAKQMQKSQKSAESLLKSIWAKLLGIGPALRVIASMSREDWAKKLHHWKDEFKSAMQHYWLGTKLLWADVRISSRLLVKLAGGKGLSRRERQQLTRTTADIFRLVPFAVFIIVPFMEFLLPVFLKLFPNMLPSTFQDKMKEQVNVAELGGDCEACTLSRSSLEVLKRRLNARIEYAKFLQDTVKEMAKEVQNSRSGEIKKTAEDLDEFMTKVRKGARVNNEEILGFAKLFNDELTLDNISRPRLVNMCKYMGISPFGTDAYLRFMLRKRLQEIKNDDRMIQLEGLESLSEAELRQACRERGLLGLLSVEEMRQQLRDWLDLSLNYSVPSSLLILSRAFSVSGKVRQEEVVQATLSSLPDEVVDTVGVTALPSEDTVSERRRKLEFLAMQEEMIKEEEEEEEELAKMQETAGSQKDVALEEMRSPTTGEEPKEKTKTMEKQEQLCELSRALAVLASASSVSREREEFLQLVKKEIDLYNSMVKKEGKDGEEEARRAYKAARQDTDQDVESTLGRKVSSALINRIDTMLHKLEKEIDDVDAKIGDRWRLLDRDYDGKVTAEEVASAAMYLKDTLGKEGIQEIISNLSKDREGKILVEDIVKLGSATEETDASEAGKS